MVKITLTKNDANMRLDKLIKKLMPTLPPSLMYKAFRKKDVKINGKWVPQEYKAKENDELTIYVSDEFLKEVPKNYDLFLTEQYGNYMELPKDIESCYNRHRCISLDFGGY